MASSYARLSEFPRRSVDPVQTNMDEEGIFTLWDELLLEILEQIFRRLPVRDRLTTVPVVCKSWQRGVAQSSCWEEIDIYESCTDSQDPELIGQMLQILLPRSCGSLGTLLLAYIDDNNFNYIADKQAFLIPNYRFIYFAWHISFYVQFYPHICIPSFEVRVPLRVGQCRSSCPS